MLRQKPIVFAIGLFVLLATCLLPSNALAGTVTLRPNGDPGVKNWTPSTGTTNWTIINRSDQATTSWICKNTGTVGDVYDLTTAPIYQGATAVNVRIYAGIGQQVLVLADDLAGVDLEVGGSLVGPTTYQAPPSPGLGLLQSCASAGFGSYAFQGHTYSGNWSQSQVDGMRLFAGRQQVGLVGDAIRISQAEAIVTYTDPPTLDQSAYRVYQNANSLTPGSAQAATNTVADLPSAGSTFRIRMGMTVSGEAWSANYGADTLQFTAKNNTTCAASTGWANVASGSGTIRWSDNASVADGATIAAVGNDPTTSGAKTYQQYRESNNFVNVAATPLTNVAIWDYSLQEVGATPGARFCFRAVNSSGSISITYSQYPEIIAIGDLSIGFVTSAGADVPSPLFGFSNLLSTTNSCQLSTGALGENAQRLRIVNDKVTNGWSVSIAATAGPTAAWATGLASYDFNDGGGSPAGCVNSDGDGRAGQLKVLPGVGSIAPKSACSTTGVSLGTNASFAQGTTDAISLLVGSSSAERFCYWDVTGVGLEQRIPATTSPGTYLLDMTVTAVAS